MDDMAIDSSPRSPTSQRDHPRPSSSEICMSKLKRRRHNATIASTQLCNLPVEAIASILRYLHPPAPISSEPTPTPLSHIRHLIPLRLVSPLFRDAFDMHILSLDLRDLPIKSFSSLLVTLLPRFQNLVYLCLPSTALSPALLPNWKLFLAKTNAHLQHLLFVQQQQQQQLQHNIEEQQIDSNIAHCIATRFINSLERLSSNSDEFFCGIGNAIHNKPNNIHDLQLHMDDISETRLICFKSLKSLKILYRRTLRPSRAQSLVQVLQALQNSDLYVHLRLSDLTSSNFNFLSFMPGLHRVSFFDGVIEESNRGIQDLAACPKLEQIHFEWVRNLTGKDIVMLAEIMKHRLKKLLIWNCEHVTDEGLVGLAKFCPDTEVELYFNREQFSPRALALLGDRVSWGSFAF